jgi:hypothetical protein
MAPADPFDCQVIMQVPSNRSEISNPSQRGAVSALTWR